MPDQDEERPGIEVMVTGDELRAARKIIGPLFHSISQTYITEHAGHMFSGFQIGSALEAYGVEALEALQISIDNLENKGVAHGGQD